jgi:hypothetical protein
MQKTCYRTIIIKIWGCLMKKLSSSIVLLTLLSACASPEVVDERELGDENLSCSQIKQEIAEAENFEKQARKEKGVTGTNVAAAVFFWPAMLVTYSNAEEAIDAAENRKKRLVSIGETKGCTL